MWNIKLKCQTTTDRYSMATAGSHIGRRRASTSTAKAKISSLTVTNKAGEKEINHAISGFNSFTPFETAYKVHKVSTILPK
tara:strand:+ start:120 stop:362 length:243 start_codon:yes stop_codon:yes gene_type:complete